MSLPRKLSFWIAAGVTAFAPTVIGAGSDQAPGAKDRPPFEKLTQVVRAASTDPDAGSWQMIVLTGPSQFPVAVPSQVTSLDYQSELTAIKNAQSRLTSAQRKSIDYWSAGGVLRWNEILLELVARADLPPAPSPDGTYPAPDANNPFADPQFPFGNPPYASRAYSYVAVAQFEALKVAWSYKYLYGRPSPARVDSSIQALVPATDLPAYPSEDAVVSGVTAELLKLLFPTMVEQITLRAGEQRQAALLSGKATASDIAAGLALGQAVAAVFTARAGADGMRTAGGTPALVQALTNAAVARGQIPWRSLENPPRPPMLPLFGSVKAWMMTPADIVNERPAEPPSTSSALMARELAEVKHAVDHLTRQQLAIVYKWADGVSTPTPPGHWNFIAESFIRGAQFSEVRTARAFALLNMAMHDAAVACWDAKFTYFNPRPSQLDPEIRTVIGLPNFPSYTSGHSTFSAAAAEVLSYLFPSGAATFEAQKEEAAISRLYGGIHYRSDIEVGKEHGKRVGGYTVRFARLDGADR
jgi:membrane-associated phospholipid phosphatase